MHWILVMAIIVFFVTLYLIPALIKMIKPRQTALNYENKEVPVGVGLVFSLILVPASIVAIIFQFIDLKLGALFIITVLAFGLLGLIDDTLGSRDACGFYGHFRALKNGYLTTGALKALFGGVIALLVSTVYGEGLLQIIVNSLNLALSANLANLLDVRPGRVGKFFLITSTGLALIGYGSLFSLLLTASVIAYLPWDLAAKAMMGDVGSNVLGVVIGFGLLSLPLGGKLIAVVILIIVHLYAERYSLTQMIATNSVLRYLDQLGRKQY